MAAKKLEKYFKVLRAGVMSPALSILFCIISFNSYSQNNSKAFKILNKDSVSVSNASVRLILSNADLHLISDSLGMFYIKNDLLNDVNKIEIKHISFETTIIKPPINSVIYLKDRFIPLENVTISSKEKVKKGKLTYQLNFGFNFIVVNFIPGKADKGKKIKTLKYNTADFGGVKGLKYLPFKANLYFVDSITNFPGAMVIPDGILLNREKDNKYVELDISGYNIKMPENGIFIAFTLLDENKYTTKLIQSRYGVINAVPTLKTKKWGNDVQTYIYYPYERFNEKESYQWVKQGTNYDMKIEFE